MKQKQTYTAPETLVVQSKSVCVMITATVEQSSEPISGGEEAKPYGWYDNDDSYSSYEPWE